jgi:DNA-binding NarL/FixJ family response regulator
VPERLPRVLIVEDHALLAESLALALRLRGFEEVEIVDPVTLSAESVIDHVERSKPEVVLLDVFLGDVGQSTPLIGGIVDHGAQVLILTASQDRVVLAQCLEAGATGVFDKAQPFDFLITSLTDAALGRTPMRPAVREELLASLDEHRRDNARLQGIFQRLTDREQSVLAAIVDGSTAEEIASDHYIAVSTVRTHIRSILEKLGVNSQLAAVALARRAGWPEGGGSEAPI